MTGVLIKGVILAALMAVASGLAVAVKPTHRIADAGPKVNLGAMIPQQFGDWRVEPAPLANVVNPQAKELLDKLYTQILTRTYINSKGQRVMLSIAYGEDQRDGLQVHLPDVCYPAQGFQLLSRRKGQIATARGAIPVRRLETVLGSQRFEPVTYWTTVGEKVIASGSDKKLAELRYGLAGQIPDGLLFRMSTISRDSELVFGLHDQFVQQLLPTLSPSVRTRLTGLAS